jgi:hypothetical protein
VTAHEHSEHAHEHSMTAHHYSHNWLRRGGVNNFAELG